MPTSISAELARFIAGLDFSDIPEPVVAHLELCLLDTFGCALYGATLPWSRLLLESTGDLDGETRSAIWGTTTRRGAAHAALVNGAAAHAFELDDLHPQSIVHPGSVVLPAALAAAELADEPVSGHRLVAAVVAGYETAARVGMSVGAAHLRQGWHPTGTHGTLGAAAAAGSVLGLDPLQMMNALGIAGSQSAGLMAAQYESMVKRFHAGRAAQSGLYAAVLARRGYTGIVHLFESKYGGYCSTFSDTYDLAVLTAGFGETWETAAVGFKPYSTNGSCHPTIDMLLAMRAEHGLRPEDVQHIDIRCSTATKEHVGWPYVPDSVTTAQMNISYIAAVTLADGDAFVDQFTEERIHDPALVDFARRVSVTAEPDIDARGDAYRHLTRIRVTRTDGSVLEASQERARGSGAFPLTRAEVRAKFGKLASKALSPAGVDELADAIERVAELDDVRDLITALTPR